MSAPSPSPEAKKRSAAARDFSSNSGRSRPLAAARRASLLPTFALVAAALAAACGRKEDTTPDERATNASLVKRPGKPATPAPGTARGVDDETSMGGLTTTKPGAVHTAAVAPTVEVEEMPTAIAPTTIAPRAGGDMAPARPIPTATARPPATTPPPAIAPSHVPPMVKGKMPAVRPTPIGGGAAIDPDDVAAPPSPAPCPDGAGKGTT